MAVCKKECTEPMDYVKSNFSGMDKIISAKCITDTSGSHPLLVRRRRGRKIEKLIFHTQNGFCNNAESLDPGESPLISRRTIVELSSGIRVSGWITEDRDTR